MKRLALLLALCLSCTHHGRPTTIVKNRQDEIAARDLGWIYDSIPVMRFNTPFLYGMLRLQVESCTGRTKNGWPKFYIAPVTPFGPSYQAAYFYEQNAIVFGLGNETNPFIVRHELIHWLVAPQDGHPPEYYGPDSPCRPLLSPEG